MSTTTEADKKAFMASQTATFKAAAIAGKGASGKPCGSHSPTIKCVEGLCCGLATPPAAAIKLTEDLIGKDMTK